MQGAMLVFLALIIPAAAAPLSLCIRRPRARRVFVSIAAGAMIVTAVLIAVRVLSGGTFALRSADYPWAGPAASLADAAILVAIFYFGVRMREWKIIVPTALQAAAVIYIEVIRGAPETEYLFNLDNLSLTMLLIASTIGPLVTVFALGYMENHEKHKGAQGAKSRQPSFFAVIFLFLTAMNIISISDNLMHLYAFWEVTTLCSFLLIGYDRTRTSYKSAKLALWLNSVGGLFFAGGILLLLQSTGSLSISYIVGHGRMMLPLLAAGVMMLCCAGFVKSAQLPFHSWLLGAMVAPTPVSALLHSSTMVKAGVYIIVRFSPVFAGTLAGDFVAIVGSFTFMTASAIAISQSNGKRVLAYSTIANLGLIIACASLGGAAGLSAAILLMIFHAVSKGLLFLCMGTVEQGIGSRNIEDMFGIYSKMPYTTSIMVLGMISMILPPFGILITKWLAIEAAVRVPPVLVLIVLGSAFTIAFWVKWLGATLTVYKPRRRGIEKLPGSMIFALGAIGLMIPVLTAMIAPINNVLVAPAVSTLLRRISPVVGGKDGGIYVRGAGGITGGFGGVLLLLGVMAVAAIVLYLVLRRSHPRIVAPYSCGEHVAGDSKGRDFVGPGDRIERIRIHNYYLSGIFSEAKLLPVSSFISVLLILIMFGVS